jgi:hypothetical protein
MRAWVKGEWNFLGGLFGKGASVVGFFIFLESA